MNKSKRKLILYISCSLDGYIAKPNDDLSFLSIVEHEGQDYGYADFVQSVDTVIIGRKTYDWVIGQGYEFPHSDKESYVLTRQARPNKGSINFYKGDLKSLVTELKNKEGKNIFCDGGSEILNQLLTDKLFDELILSIVPIIVGNGTKLFKEGILEQELKLKSVNHFEKGLVQLHYELKKNE
jgi:dihydrofolate reductase